MEQTVTQQHTPGPWRVKTQSVLDAGLHIRTSDLERHIAHIIAPVDTQDEANARLIAAAPDLLAALEALTEEFEYVTMHQDFRNRVAAAIARARGED